MFWSTLGVQLGTVDGFAGSGQWCAQLGTGVAASRDQAGGVLSCAAVPRVGLGPTTPP